MAVLPYMQWYPGDFTASMDVRMMSDMEELTYRRLLDACWMSGTCSIPDDAKSIRSLCGRNASASVLAKFEPHPEMENCLTNARLYQQFVDCIGKSEKAKAAADKRWKKHRASLKSTGKAACERNADAPQTHMRTACESDAMSESESYSESTPVSKDTVPKGTASKNFIKPTLADVTTYCIERKNGVDPAAWMDHYTSNGWKVGKNPMKDWKATVRTWERNQFGTAAKRSTANPRTYTQGGGKQWDGVPTL